MSNTLFEFDFTDLDRNFDFGKLLVLKQSSKMTADEIKRLTGTQSLTELTNPMELLHPVTMLHDCLHTVLECLAQYPVEYGIKVIQVDANAVSTLYALADTHFLCALVFKGDSFKGFNSLVTDAKNMEMTWQELRVICDYYNDFEADATEADDAALFSVTDAVQEDQWMAIVARSTYELSKKTYAHAIARLKQEIQPKW